jgi:hypothetical protein
MLQVSLFKVGPCKRFLGILKSDSQLGIISVNSLVSTPEHAPDPGDRTKHRGDDCDQEADLCNKALLLKIQEKIDQPLQRDHEGGAFSRLSRSKTES